MYQTGPYGEQLRTLMQDPSTVSSMPGYEAGRQAVERSMASQGYQGSGNMAAAMAEFGGDFYLKQLQALSGARTQEMGAQTQMGQLGLGYSQLGLESQKFGAQQQQFGLNRMDELDAGEEYRRMMELFSKQSYGTPSPFGSSTGSYNMPPLPDQGYAQTDYDSQEF